MKRVLGTLCVGLLSTMFAACGGGGGGGGPAAKPGTVNRQGAATVITTTGSLKTAVEGGDGSNLSGATISLGLSGAQQIVQPGAAASALTAVMSALSQPGPNGGTVDCTETGCVYADYKTGTTTLNGSVKSAKAGDTTTVTADLTIKQPSQTAQQGDVNWKVSGSIDFGAGSIDGQLTSTAKSSITYGGQTISYDYFNLIDYRALVIGATGAATGGEIYAKWAITVAGVPQGSQAYDGTVKFPQ